LQQLRIPILDHREGILIGNFRHAGGHRRRPACFIGNAKKQGSVPESYDVPAAHTPAFQGSHVNGDRYQGGLQVLVWILDIILDHLGDVAPPESRRSGHPHVRRSNSVVALKTKTP
jgi:hypothetical protein